MTQLNQSYGTRTAVIGYVILAVLCIGVSVAPIFVWLFPVPLIVLLAKNERRLAILLACLLVPVLWFSGLGVFGVLFALALNFVSLLLQDTLTGKEIPFPRWIAASMVYVLLFLLVMAFAHWSGVNLADRLSTWIRQSLTQDQSLLHLDPQRIASVGDATTQWMLMMIPAMIVMTSFLLVILASYLARWVVRREMARLPSWLASWRIPASIIPLYMLSLIVVLLKLGGTSGVWPQVIHNLLFLCGFFLGVQGLSFVWRWLSGRTYAKGWMTLCLLGSLFGLVGSIFVILGVLDIMQYSRRKA